MQALILAGGEGTRMRRLTACVPKPLLYLPGGTLLEHQLAVLSPLSISHIFVVVRHRAEQMAEALLAYESITILPQKAPFTLLGALASAEGYVTEPFIVLHADNYFSQGLEYLLQEAQGALLGGGSDAAFLIDPQDDRLERALRLASTGCYLLSPAVFPAVKKVQAGDKLISLTTGLLDSGALVQEVQLRGWRANINHLGDLMRVSGRILEDWPACVHPPGAGKGYNRFEGSVKAKLPLWISVESEVVDSCLGPNVVVGPRACVRNCMLRDVIVFPGAEIVGQQLERDVVLVSS